MNYKYFKIILSTFQTAAVVGDQQSAEDRAEGIFNKMDVNSDGKVTRYIKLYAKYFENN